MANRLSAWVEVEDFITETDEAVLVSLTGDKGEFWFPFSQIDQTQRNPDGSGRILVALWLLKKEGLV